MARSTTANSIATTGTTGTNVQSSSASKPKLLFKEDIDTTLASIEAPLKTLDTLTSQLNELSKTWAKFGTEIDQLAKQKGVGDNSKEAFTLWGGISFLEGVQMEVLSRYVKSFVSQPIEKVIDNYGEERKQIDENFQLSYHDLVRQLRAAEKAQNKLSNSKTRNINKYRSSLEELTQNLDTIDNLKSQYYKKSSIILENACSKVSHIGARMVQLQLEMAANVASKNANHAGGIGHWLNDSIDNADLSMDYLDSEGEEDEYNSMSDQEFLGELEHPFYDNSTLKSPSRISDEQYRAHEEPEEPEDECTTPPLPPSNQSGIDYKPSVPPQSPVW